MSRRSTMGRTMPDQMAPPVSETKALDALPKYVGGPTMKSIVSVVIPAKNQGRNPSHVVASTPSGQLSMARPIGLSIGNAVKAA